MIDDKVIFLCPESVPLDNKGEEAIIKGVIDTLGLPHGKYEFHIIDPSVKECTYKRGLFLHPLSLFYPKWRMLEFGFGFSKDRIYASICSLLRHTLNKVIPNWVNLCPRSVSRLVKYIKLYKEGKISNIPRRYLTSIEHLSHVDYIISGHNGGLSIEVCHCLLSFKHKLNVHYCIFGSCMKPRVNEHYQLEVYRKMFTEADIVVSRNPIGFKWANKYFPEVHARLAPDPAFGMKPISKNNAKLLIQKLGLTSFFQKEVIMITNAEPAPISRKSFDSESSREAKISAHRRFFAILINELAQKYKNINFLFLPHTIGPTLDMDDREISKNIIARSNQHNDLNGQFYVLEADLSAAELKGIISLGKMLIAERVHSVIGAIGVHTPVLCLASQYDTRVEGMLKGMAHFTDNIYYLNSPNISDCINKIDYILDNLEDNKNFLTEVDEAFLKQLSMESMQINKLIHISVPEYEYIN